MQALIIILMLISLAACRGEDKTSQTEPAGDEKTAKTKVLEAGADVLQARDPIDQINIHVHGFHFENGNMQHQMGAHHFCTKVNEEFTQCVLYNSTEKNARLIGIEYIVSKKIFDTLASDEKALWHSHVYEVKSGQLAAPGIPEPAEHELMEQLAGTYGKTWHTWMKEQDQVPSGIPGLMMGFTADGQIRSDLLSTRNKEMNISVEEKRKNRNDIVSPSIDPGADAWQKGDVVKLESRKENTNSGDQ